MNTIAKAHGMDGTLVDPDWPPLELSEVCELLSRYPELDEPIEILTVSPRPFSAASIVATSNGRAFIKRHHRSVRSAEGLNEEHRFMEHLLDAGAQVPRVLRNASGETAIEMGEWTYEVHEAPECVDLYRDAQSWTPFRAAAHAYSAGAALARMHLASERFAKPQRRQHPLIASFTIFAAQDVATAMDRYVAARPTLRDYLRTRSCRDEALELLMPFHAELLPHLPALSSLWTHNDLHASNLLWSDSTESARAAAIIDFGLSDRTNAVHDLGHAIVRNIVEWLALVEAPAHPDKVPVHLDHLSALLDGYESVRSLSSEEAAALAPMTALCHAEFALSETDYLLSVLHCEEQAPMACEGWLVGHARWFRGEAGKRLLDAIRTRTDARDRRRRGATQQ